ncbi:MAG: serine/threonine-protein kinase [Pirellulaceae bacterium]
MSNPSSNPSTDLNLESATQTWDVLARHLDRFIEHWEGGSPPTVADHLPEADGTFRRMALVELIKIDLEYRAKAEDLFKPVERYVAEFPELVDGGGVPCDLLYEEFHVRRSQGEDVDPEELFNRFPDKAEELKRLLGFTSPVVSTALFGQKLRSDDLEPGDRVDDFSLLLRLGKGAFATVYLARQESMQRMVALKVSADRGQEPQTLAQLDHPNIVRVYDTRALPQQRMRLMYMQYLAGGTLQGVIERVRRIPPSSRTGEILLAALDEELERNGQPALTGSPARKALAAMSWPKVVCRIGFQLAKALQHAHDKGVLHRDIKPANVLLAADGTPKLADFNISFSSQLDGATPAAYFGGSLAYMSPEQLEACNPSHQREPESLDGRSDLYSLAVMLWELLYGVRPFRDEKLAGAWSQTLNQMASRRREGPPTEHDPFEEVAGEPELRQVLMRCMSPDPAQRFASGDEFARELRLCHEARTQQILKLPSHGWREFVRRQPIVAIAIAAVLPNLVAAVFNFLYNNQAIIDVLDAEGSVEGARQAFNVLVILVNSTFFPGGFFLGVWLAWPVLRRVKDAGAPPLPEEDLVSLRVKSLGIGPTIATICIVLWLVAGVVYPVFIHLTTGDLTEAGGPLKFYLHFVVSMVLCCLISLIYPFYFITYLSMRVLYPTLLQNSSPSDADVEALRVLSKRCRAYLVLAASVPVFAAAIFGVANYTNLDTAATWAPAAVALIGIAGVFLTFWMNSVIQHDIAAVLRAATPVESFGVSTDSMDTFF